MHNARTVVVFLCAVFLWVVTLATASAAAPEVYDIKIMEMVGRPGHEGLFPIQGQPIVGAKAIVQARVDGFADKVNLILRDSGGHLLSKIQMIVPPADKVVGGTYFADIVIPAVPFTMSISGEDQENNEFEGIPEQPSANTPQVFDVRIIPTIYEIPPNVPLYFSVRVTNYGALDTFSVSLTSDVGGTVEPVSKNINLNINQSAEIQFLYTAPANIEAGFDYITLTATASSVAPNGATNQAILKLTTPMQAPGKLTAWLNIGEQGMLLRSRKAPLIVWLCNDNIDSQTILLANNVSPSSTKIIPKGYSSAGSSSEHKLCAAKSRFKLEFDSVQLIESLRKSSGLTSKSRLTNIPISAYSADGIPMFGYIPVVLDAQDQSSSGKAQDQHSSSKDHDHADK